MSYIEYTQRQLKKNTNRQLTEFLSNVKPNDYSRGFFLNSAFILLHTYCCTLNFLMEYYIKNPSEQVELDSKFNNFFKNNLNNFFNLEFSSNLDKLNVSFNEQNQAFFQMLKNVQDINSAFNNYNKKGNAFFYNEKQPISFTIDFFIANNKLSHTEQIKQESFNNNPCFTNVHSFILKLFSSKLSIFEKEIEFLKEIALISHTNKLRDYIIRYFPSQHLKEIKIKKESPYSILYIQDFLNEINSFLSKKEHSKQYVENLYYLNQSQLNDFINILYERDTHFGKLKDLDEFNLPLIQPLSKLFFDKFDLIEKVNLTKLRIIRNIAKEKGVELNYKDERSTVNSLTDKQMIIFGDKVDCEAIIIDLNILVSRFPNQLSTSVMHELVNIFFNFTKELKVLKRIQIHQGKRSLSNILIVLCEKDKNHSHEMLEELSECFETAVFSLPKDSKEPLYLEFENNLSSILHEIQLSKQLKNGYENIKSKKKI